MTAFESTRSSGAERVNVASAPDVPRSRGVETSDAAKHVRSAGGISGNKLLEISDTGNVTVEAGGEVSRSKSWRIPDANGANSDFDNTAPDLESLGILDTDGINVDCATALHGL